MFRPQNANRAVELGHLKIQSKFICLFFAENFAFEIVYLKRKRARRHLNLFPESDVLWLQPPTELFKITFKKNVSTVF